MVCFFFQAEDGIRDYKVTGVQTCALPIWARSLCAHPASAHSSTVRGRGVGRSTCGGHAMAGDSGGPSDPRAGDRVARRVPDRGGGGGAKPPRPRPGRCGARIFGGPVSEMGWTGLARGKDFESLPQAQANFPDEWLAHSLEGVVSPELLVELRAKAQPGQTLWETLVAQKIATDAQILTGLSTRFRLKLAEVLEIDPEVKEKVPEQLARRFHILPLRITDSFLEIATANPFDLDAEKALAFATAREIRMQLLAPSKIHEKLDEMYRPEKTLDKLVQGMEGSPDLVQLVEDQGPEEIAVSEEQASQRPVVRLVDLIISEGILARSSDIHIEPEEGGVAVRYRIDGVLRQVMKIPRQAGLPLISRLKIMSSLDIADRLRPQDGRARVAVNGQPIDLRVSTLA